MEIFYTVVIVTLIICVFLAWYFTHKAKHQEKMLRIEMGILEPDQAKEKSNFSHVWIKLAFLIVGQGVAFLIISMLVALKWINDGVPIAIMALMGGVSMLVPHKILTKKQKN